MRAHPRSARVWAVGGHVGPLDRAPAADDFGYLLSSSAADVGGQILYWLATSDDF
jgi:hypothetical protein